MNLKIRNSHVKYYTVSIINKSVLLEDCTIVYVGYKEMTLESVRTKLNTYSVGILLAYSIKQIKGCRDVSAYNTRKLPCKYNVLK